MPDVQVSKRAQQIAATDLRTKFPIRSLGTLKQLAANVEPIPVPSTVPPPPRRPVTAGTSGRSAGGGHGAGNGYGQPGDVIVID
jgi:hypothetical protein